MSELPQGWLISKLGDIAGKGQYGWTTKASSNGSVRFLRTTDITKREINWPTVPFCEEPPEDLDKFVLKTGDIIISRAGSVGFNKLLTSVPEKAVFASYLIRFRPSNAIDPKFLAAYLKSDDYWNGIKSASAGIALANVNAANLGQLLIPLPPLAEQTRIANQLDTLLTRIQSCNDRFDAIPALLRRFRQTVLDAATLGTLTESWRKTNGGDYEWKNVELRDIAEVQGGVTKDAKKQSALDEEVPYLRVANVQRGYINLTDVKTIRVPNAKLEGLLLEKGDVLFNEGGDLDKLGRGWIWEGQISRCTFQNHVFRARLFDKGNQPKFLSWWGNSRGLEYFIRSGKQTTNLASINKTMLAALPIRLPSAAEQSEIVRRVEALFTLADHIEARATAARTHAQRLSPLVLAKAFRGKLVPQDPQDEPASALLKRIVAQRAMPTAKKQTNTPRQAHTPRKPKEAVAMTKNRQDDDVKDKPYLAGHLRRLGVATTAEVLFKASELPIADFYKQLAWEVAQGHIADGGTTLEARHAAG